MLQTQQQAATKKPAGKCANMKVNEILREAYDDSKEPWEQDDYISPYDGIADPDMKDGGDKYGQSPEMELSSNIDTKMVNAVKRVCDEYKGQGHAQVEILPFISKVVEIAKKPVNLADLIAINKKSPEIRSIIDSIDDKKIKFKNMSVKNDDKDPNEERAKQKEKNQATVSSMASRAIG